MGLVSLLVEPLSAKRCPLETSALVTCGSGWIGPVTKRAEDHRAFPPPALEVSESSQRKVARCGIDYGGRWQQAMQQNSAPSVSPAFLHCYSTVRSRMQAVETTLQTN